MFIDAVNCNVECLLQCQHHPVNLIPARMEALAQKENNASAVLVLMDLLGGSVKLVKTL